MARKKTKEERLLQFIGKYGEYYDYSKFLDDSFILEGSHQKIQIICPIHGEWNTTSIDSHCNGRGCPTCGGSKKKTKKQWVKKFKTIHGDFYDYSKFLSDNFILTGVHQKIPIICPIHGEWNTTSIDSHCNGRGCPTCGGFEKKSKEYYIDGFIKSNVDKNYGYTLFMDDIFIIENSQQKIPIICPIHGLWDTTTINNHLRGRGCPTCSVSKGELKVEELLKENNHNFTKQKRFKDCKYKAQLPFDFYLPEQNLCIEFDGIQHFIPKDYFGGKEALKLQKKKDRIKTKYCKDNGIKLLRIRYDEDIEEKMKEIFLLE